MTTTVIINAHCDDKTEVQIGILDKGIVVEEHTIQDGESSEQVVYDDRMIKVREIKKGE